MSGRKMSVAGILLLLAVVCWAVPGSSGEHPWDVDQRDWNRWNGGIIGGGSQDTIIRNDSTFIGGTRTPGRPGQRGSWLTRWTVYLSKQLVSFSLARPSRTGNE